MYFENLSYVNHLFSGFCISSISVELLFYSISLSCPLLFLVISTMSIFLLSDIIYLSNPKSKRLYLRSPRQVFQPNGSERKCVRLNNSSGTRNLLIPMKLKRISNSSVSYMVSTNINYNNISFFFKIIFTRR